MPTQYVYIRKKSDAEKGLDRATAIKGVLTALIVTGDTLAIQDSWGSKGLKSIAHTVSLHNISYQT